MIFIILFFNRMNGEKLKQKVNGNNNLRTEVVCAKGVQMPNMQFLHSGRNFKEVYFDT